MRASVCAFLEREVEPMINYNRRFHDYTPPRLLVADIRAIEQDIVRLLAE